MVAWFMCFGLLQEDINVFETTIRVIGGLLSAYDLSHDKLFLTKAKEVADKLSFAFDSPTGVPYGTIGLRTHRKYNPSWTQHASTISEVCRLAWVVSPPCFFFFCGLLAQHGTELERERGREHQR